MAKPKHDPFVSRSLEFPSIAKSFLSEHTPTHLKKYINWEALARIDRSNTDTKLKKLHRDILYKTSLKEDRDIIWEIEHQSKPDPIMPIRYLRYDANILETYIKKGHTKWPLIINLLLYNGNTSPYPYSSETLGYYRHTIEGKEQLYLFFYLLDLTQISDKELLTHGLCAPMEIMLKHSRDGNFEENISAYREVFHECIEAVGDDYIVSMLEYADSLKDYEIGEKMHKFVEEVFRNKQELNKFMEETI
jgi:predicted transposase/invertase (TIGR01784 family)